jgi:L-aminopeptidase/D-esterase-like protein
VIGADGAVLGGPRADDGSLERSSELLAAMRAPSEWTGIEERNTTLVCLMTDAALDKAGCSRTARMASSGVARAVDPVFSDFDGDVVFCLAGGQAPARPRDRFMAISVGTLAAGVTADAIRAALS